MAQTPIDDQLTEIRLVCREAPGLVLRGAYLRAARHFCEKTRWLLKPASFTTAVEAQFYTLPPPDLVSEVIGIQAGSLTLASGEIKVLTEGYSGEWDPNQPTGDSGCSDTYQYIPEGQVAISRTPGAAWLTNWTVAVQPRRGVDAIDTTLVAAWDHALEAGALAFLLNLPRAPWTDKNEAQRQDAVFKGLCNQAHMSAQRGFNAGAQTTDRPGSSSGAVRTRMLPI